MERVDPIEEEHAARAVVPSRCVRLSGETARVVIPSHAGGEPHIELIREGNVIQAIDVTCTCGQRIRLRCVYES
jgi:hypothetical protein